MASAFPVAKWPATLAPTAMATGSSGWPSASSRMARISSVQASAQTTSQMEPSVAAQWSHWSLGCPADWTAGLSKKRFPAVPAGAAVPIHRGSPPSRIVFRKDAFMAEFLPAMPSYTVCRKWSIDRPRRKSGPRTEMEPIAWAHAAIGHRGAGISGCGEFLHRDADVHEVFLFRIFRGIVLLELVGKPGGRVAA